MIASEVIYKEAVIFLATAALVVPLFMKLRISSIFGFLLVGLGLGPSGLGQLVEAAPWLEMVTILNPDNIAHLAEFGIVFLMFMIGIELSLDRLLSMRRYVFGLGGLHLALSMASIFAILHWLGWDWPQASIGAACLGLSSTAIVAQVLTEQKRMTSNTGRISLSILLFQDLAVIPIILAADIVSPNTPSSFGIDVLWVLLRTVFTIGFVYFMGRLVMRPLLRWAAGAHSPELFMAACLLAILSAGLVSTISGVSMALGAFIAGIILAETEFSREIEVIMEPFKGLLLGLFFFSVGVSIELAPIFSSPLTLLIMIAGILVAKALAMSILGLVFQLPRRGWVESALLLAPAGEFAFVVVSASAAVKLFSNEQDSLLMAAATISMVLIPLMPRLARALMRIMPSPNVVEPKIEVPEHLAHAQVIIAGYGRVGALLGSMLKEHKIGYVAVDYDAKVVGALHNQGQPVYYGDIGKLEFLERIGAAQARALIVTMSSKEKVLQVSKLAKEAFPHLLVIARAHDPQEAAKLYEVGVDEAIPETIEASLHLGEAALVGLGIPVGLAIASIHQRRDDFRKEYQRINIEERTGFLRRQYKLQALKDGE